MKLISFYLFILFFAINSNAATISNVIIPKPNSLVTGKGTFTFTKPLKLTTNLSGDERKNLLGYIKLSNIQVEETRIAEKNDFLHLLIVDSLSGLSSPESYQLSITVHGIILKSTTGVGLFHGIQSLLQIREVFKNKLPLVEIKDSPRFAYRGMHLDVSRHFYTKAFIKKQLDMMAYYKLNNFHWHLTDGAGWRIEIKKYPLLTDVAAWRPFPNWKAWDEGGRTYCKEDNPIANGGYYTQEDVKEIVAYAKSRYITVIPEIEMPGHSEEVLAVYPQLSCSGKPYVDSDFCIGNESTFTFLQDVLSEIIPLFPSQYIHIGGDEASKKGWKTCPLCQARMRTNNLKNENELQSYLIHRIEKFLNSKGKKIIGWDEILEGGLSSTTTVMAWRDESQLKSIKSGHQTIMTPTAYCYLDFYQDAPCTQPEAMSAFLPLKKVYSFNPIPNGLTVDEQKLFLGVQANVWTERMPTVDHTEYMIYPRLLAIAEVGWTAPELKSYPEFRERAINAVSMLKSKGYHPFDLKNEVGRRQKSLQPVVHIAVGKPVKYLTMYEAKYKANEEKTLTDGLLGDWSYSDERWQGFLEKDLDVIINLEKITDIHSVSAQFMQDYGADIWMPSGVTISVSQDGIIYETLSTVYPHISLTARKVSFEDFGWKGSAKALYIHYKASKANKSGGWLFTDEIELK